MHRSLATSCWDHPATLPFLTRNPSRYVALAQALIDAVPGTWNRISAHLVLTSSGQERCSVSASCGDAAAADDACRDAVRLALASLGRGALLPVRALWIGIWVDYDVNGDLLSVTLMHGGQIQPRLLAPFEKVLVELKTGEEDTSTHPLS